MVQKKLPFINSAHGSDTRNIINEIIKAVNDRGLEILSESGFLTWLEENGIKHREEVATVTDLPMGDSLNTVRGVVADNKIYIKKENGWVPFQTIDISKINYVEEKADRANENFAYLSIKDFPRLAVETEDSARINRAINSTSGGVIQLFNELYTTTNPIKLKDNITLQGQNPFKTIIKNTNNTNIVTTINNSERHYYSQVNDLTLDGTSIGTQTGLHLPHTSYFTSRNLVIRNVSRCHYMVGKLTDGTITGSYYNHFYNPVFSHSKTGFYFDTIANENTVYGGKLMVLDTGVEIHSNSVKFFGTALEGIKNYHFKLYNINNAFYSIRMEGYDSSIGILNDVQYEGYANYFYTPHFQAVNTLYEDVSDSLMIFHDRGLKIPLRVHDIALKTTRKLAGPQPLIKMEDSSNGPATIYQSKKKSFVGNHFEAMNGIGEYIATISGYGEYENHIPNRGFILKSPNGSRYAVRVNDAGELISIKI